MYNVHWIWIWTWICLLYAMRPDEAHHRKFTRTHHRDVYIGLCDFTAK